MSFVFWLFFSGSRGTDSIGQWLIQPDVKGPCYLVRSIVFKHCILYFAADHNSALSPGFVTYLFAWQRPTSCMCEDFQGESRALLSFVPKFCGGTQDSLRVQRAKLCCCVLLVCCWHDCAGSDREGRLFNGAMCYWNLPSNIPRFPQCVLPLWGWNAVIAIPERSHDLPV